MQDFIKVVPIGDDTSFIEADVNMLHSDPVSEDKIEYEEERLPIHLSLLEETF